jgi:hypothetical protein
MEVNVRENIRDLVINVLNDHDKEKQKRRNQKTNNHDFFKQQTF